jgi:predicted nucleic acid-binding protein
MKVFVDTIAWLALYDRNDRFHHEAKGKLSDIQKNRIDLVTSDYILDESLTIVRLRVNHAAAVVFGTALLNSRIVQMIHLTEADKSAAWEIFRKFSDKDFSFTDCTSFAVMKRLGLQSCFTFDAHFGQMGFEPF